MQRHPERSSRQIQSQKPSLTHPVHETRHQNHLYPLDHNTLNPAGSCAGCVAFHLAVPLARNNVLVVAGHDMSAVNFVTYDLLRVSPLIS